MFNFCIALAKEAWIASIKMIEDIERRFLFTMYLTIRTVVNRYYQPKEFLVGCEDNKDVSYL